MLRVDGHAMDRSGASDDAILWPVRLSSACSQRGWSRKEGTLGSVTSVVVVGGGGFALFGETISVGHISLVLTLPRLSDGMGHTSVNIGGRTVCKAPTTDHARDRGDQVPNGDEDGNGFWPGHVGDDREWFDGGV